MIQVTRIEPDDDRFPEVLRLDRELLPDASPPSENTEWWIAWDTETLEIAGYAGARLLESGIYFMSRAGVVPAYRGRGLQRRLIRVRVARGRKLCARLTVTYTIPENVRSSNNLIACGFRTYIPGIAYAGEGVIYWYHRGTKTRSAVDPLSVDLTKYG